MKILQGSTVAMAFALIFAAPTALAGYTCTGAARGVAIDVGGDVLVESIGPLLWPRLCNVRTSANNVAPEACKAIYASLLTAQASGKTVTVWVSDTGTTCTSLAQWQYVAGFYFLRVDG